MLSNLQRKYRNQFFFYKKIISGEYIPLTDEYEKHQTLKGAFSSLKSWL